MDLFFVASKVMGALLMPSNLLLLMAVAALGLQRFVRTRGWSARLAFLTLALFSAIVVLPVGDGMVFAIERRFAPLDACIAGKEFAPGGIILLGGGVSSQRVEGKVRDQLNEASDRVHLTAQLAKQFPDIPIVVSGGQAFDNGTDRKEASAMADLLAEFGIDTSRLVLESNSRTTSENASLAAAQTDGRAWILVTSAFHMPRSIGTFRKAGVNVVAAPTDWRLPDSFPLFSFDAASRLSMFDLGVREYLGLLAYWLTGRSSELLPGPGSDCAEPA